MNQALASLPEGSLEFTLTVPLIKPIASPKLGQRF